MVAVAIDGAERLRGRMIGFPPSPLVVGGCMKCVSDLYPGDALGIMAAANKVLLIVSSAEQGRNVPQRCRLLSIKCIIVCKYDIINRGEQPFAGRRRRHRLCMCASHTIVDAARFMRGTTMDGRLERAAHLPGVEASCALA